MSIPLQSVIARTALLIVVPLIACNGVSPPRTGEQQSALSTAGAPPKFTLFETGQVRPLALHNKMLYALNTPDNRLEVFGVRPNGLAWRGAVVGGLHPRAAAPR